MKLAIGIDIGGTNTVYGFIDQKGNVLHFKEIQTFFDTMPKLKHEITAVCKSCKKENKKVLEGMGDFFA